MRPKAKQPAFERAGHHRRDVLPEPAERRLHPAGLLQRRRVPQDLQGRDPADSAAGPRAKTAQGLQPQSRLSLPPAGPQGAEAYRLARQEGLAPPGHDQLGQEQELAD